MVKNTTSLPEAGQLNRIRCQTGQKPMNVGSWHTNVSANATDAFQLQGLEAVAASISHEMRQPLTAISANARAARRFLGHVPPNLEEVRSAQDRVISDSHRASQILDNIRALFGRGDQAHEPVPMCSMYPETAGKKTWICPPRRSVSAAPPPR
jgi:signal transduction histidine kinase